MASETVAWPNRRAETARSRQRRNALRNASVGLALTAPAMLLMLILLIGPMAAVFVLAFTDYQLGDSTLHFVGLANFAALATDRVFSTSLTNTLLYAAIVVPSSVGLGLAVALLIEAGTGLRSFYRAAFFLPVMATLIAMAIVWEFMLHPSFGLVNLALRHVGLPEQNWLQDGRLAPFVLAAIGIWQQFGFNMVLFLAGIVSIPRQLYEAAAMDGVPNAWERFRLVTWPMLAPVTLFVVVISGIRSFQVFDTVHALTRGGPNKTTEVLLHTMYAEGLEFFRTGYAAAIAVVFIFLVLILALVKMFVLEKRVHYA